MSAESLPDAVEVRRTPNDVLPLGLAGTCSAVLMTGIAFAAKQPTPSTSMSVALRTVLLVLTVAALGLVFILKKRSHSRGAVQVSSDALLLTHDDGGVTRIPRKSILFSYVVADGDRWSVDVERLMGTVKVIFAERSSAEKLASALGGMTARVRMRLGIKSSYFMFCGVVATWLLVYCGLVALPWYPILGVVVVASMVPLAMWVTKQTVPGKVVISDENVAIIRPRGVQSLSRGRIREVFSQGEHEALVVFNEGGEVSLGLLVHYAAEPPPKGVTTPPSLRLREAVLDKG